MFRPDPVNDACTAGTARAAVALLAAVLRTVVNRLAAVVVRLAVVLALPVDAAARLTTAFVAAVTATVLVAPVAAPFGSI